MHNTQIFDANCATGNGTWLAVLQQ